MSTRRWSLWKLAALAAVSAGMQGASTTRETAAFAPSDARCPRVAVSGNRGNGRAGAVGIDAFQEAPSNPGGGGKERLLWDSAAWSNGKLRSWTSHGDFDPFDDRVMLAAGEGRKFTVFGDGTARLDGNRARIYIHAEHRNAELNFEANATDSSLENISTKLRSRHQEGGSPANRFGGYGVSFNLKEDEVEFKVEPYHNVHESGKSFKLDTPLDHDTWHGYKVRIDANADDSKATVKAYIDYGLTGTWKEVGSATYDRTGFTKNDLNARYCWIRANSGEAVQKGLKLRNARFIEHR